MKPISLFTTGSLLVLSLQLQAQCIADVYYLEDSPVPCNFVGTVDFNKTDCFDFTASPAWKYTWRIWDADDGGEIASYDGFAFNHVFEKFGGYTFCVEIDKNLATPGPEHVECVTYTTCQPCGDSQIEFEYNNCPTGEGCNMSFTANINALNTVGVKNARYVFRYIPPAPQQQGGMMSYDIEEIPVDLSYVPGSETIDFSEDVNFYFARGCYEARIEFELEEEYAPHSIKDGPLCDRFTLIDDQVFQCVACNDESCETSRMATEISNEAGECLHFVCPFFRSTEFDAGYMETQKLQPTVYPNPASDLVQISILETGHDNMTMYLLDARGMQLHSGILNSSAAYELDVSQFQPGMYFLLFKGGGEVVHTEKLVIR